MPAKTVEKSSFHSLDSDSFEMEIKSYGDASIGFSTQSFDSLTDNSSKQYSIREDRLSKPHENPLTLMVNSDRDKNLRSNKVVQELTINKLQYDKVGMIGRESEYQFLEKCFDRMTERKFKELILIKGQSGVGKSHFASSIRPKVSENGLTGAFVEGKFDIQAGIREPYSAVASAFGKLCSKALDDENQQVGAMLATELGSDACQLATLVPELYMVLQSSDADSSHDQDQALAEGHDFEASQKRFEYAFRVLARILSSKFSPLIVVLDDLQWADEYSLGIIDLLLSDADNSNPMMIIGCYRAEEYDETSALGKFVAKIGAQKLDGTVSKRKFQLAQIELDCLNVKQANAIIMALLDIDDGSKTEALADLCFRRTLGNPHFVLEFITMLEEEGLLTFSLGTLEWRWDLKQIEEKTMSTENVVDLLQGRMRKLPEKLQLLLQYAACLGTSIRIDVLSLVWTRHAKEKAEDLSALCDQLESGHFLEAYGSQEYRWTHDKVKEATLEKLEDSSLFQYEVGGVLFESYRDDTLGDMLFEVTDLVNAGTVSDRLDYATLNLQAAEKARNISAFSSSALYASKGIGFLPENKWDVDHQLTLKLYTIGTEMELALGNPENMQAYSKEVLSQTKCSALEKNPIYMVNCYKLMDMDMNAKEASKTLVNALRELNVSLFRYRAMVPVSAVASLMKTLKLAKRTPRSKYHSLPLMSDKKHLAIMRSLSRLAYVSYVGSDNFLQVLSVVKMVKMTLEHGVSGETGFAFANLGLLTVVIMKDVDTAAFFAEMALMMQNKSPHKFGEASTIFVANKYIFPWKQPLPQCNLKDGYKSGVKSGNVEMAMWCHVNDAIAIPMQSGIPLYTIQSKCATTLALCEELKQDLHGVYVKIYWQVALNLMALDDETTKLNGSVCRVEELTLETFGLDIDFHTTALRVIFGEFEEAAKSAIKRGDKFDKERPGMQDGLYETFLRGIALYAMSRKKKERKYRRHANKTRQKIKAWVKRGNPNIKHFYSLLCAEHASLDKDHSLAKSKYIESITIAARTGNLMMAALSNERYADYFHDIGDEEESTYRMDEAIRFYKRWGAEAKVSQLIKARHDCRF